MQVAKWGNSLAVRLPAALADALGLKEGDEITIKQYDAAQSALGIAKTPNSMELIADIRRKYAGLIPADFKFDREEANQRIPHEQD